MGTGNSIVLQFDKIIEKGQIIIIIIFTSFMQVSDHAVVVAFVCSFVCFFPSQ